MTDFARRTVALAFTTVASALLLIAAVGPAARTTAPAAGVGPQVASSQRLMA